MAAGSGLLLILVYLWEAKIISQIEYSYSSFIPVAVIKRSQNSLGEERKGFISAYRLQSIAEGWRNPMQKPRRSPVS